jgi:hypothetical protein
MSSEQFKQIVEQQLGKKIRRSGTQGADLIAAASLKAMSLQGMFQLRAEEGLLEEDIQDFEAAAFRYVELILRDAADEDVEKLANQETFRLNKKSKTKVASLGLLRDKRNRVISPLNLQRLLNLTLVKFTQSLMGTSGRLNNQTGRLANSGTVTEVRETPKSRSASFFFTYMLYPYQVFEPGGSMGSSDRSPQQLFKDAINLALTSLLHPTSLPERKHRRIIMRGGRE